jgi:hypothetical protein
VELLVAHTDVYLDGLVHAERLTAREIVTALPVPLVDPSDVGATVLSATVLSQPVQTLDSLRAARHGALDSEGIDLTESVELPLMEVRALLDLGDIAKATRKLDSLAERVGWQWRLVWFRAVSELLTGDYESATKHFTEVLDREFRWTDVLRHGVEHRQRGDLGGFRVGAGAVGRGQQGGRGADVGRRAGDVPPLHHRATDQRDDAAVGAVDERAHRGPDPRRRTPGRGAAGFGAEGVADPRAGARHRAGLDR